MRRLFWCFLLALSTLGSLSGADAPIYLKSTPQGAGSEPWALTPVPLKRMAAGRSHILLQFAQGPQPEQIAELKRRGIRPLQYVPEGGLMVSMEDGVRLDHLAVRWAGRLGRSAKLSPHLANEARDASGDFFVAEFFPDVSQEEARTLATEEGFQVYDHPDLVSNHLLIRGFREGLASLTEWDEVAYIFPASDDLAQGRRVHGCPGALTVLGPVSQAAARVSEGWDGPGQGSAELGYFFQSLTQRLPQDKVKSEILRALTEWTHYASLSFLPAAAPTSVRTLNFLFARGDHGDGYPFDGPGNVLAHTFYPAPPNPEPIAGDVHFDDDEEWVAGPDLTIRSVDLFSVALHEIGHALGLPHADIPGTVMYPYYHRLTSLTTSDIQAIQQLYAAPSTPSGDQPAGTPPAASPLAVMIQSPAVFPYSTSETTVSMSGTVTGGSGDARVNWTTDRGAAGVALGGRNWSSSVPLATGDNVVTINATDATRQQASRSVVITRQLLQTALSVRITSPTSGPAYTTGSTSITLAGAVSPSSGIARVQWTNSRGGLGMATGTGAWTAGPIGLWGGTSVITVTAYTSSGASASASLTVTCTATVTDTVAPSLTILSPASTAVLTYSATISLRGTASDNVGVTQVTWTTSTGKSGVATGTTSWSAVDIPLLVGTNNIVVRALDAAGNAGWRSITVTRR